MKANPICAEEKYASSHNIRQQLLFQYIRKTVEISAGQVGNIFSFVRNFTAIVHLASLGSSETLLSDVMFRDKELPEDQNPRRDR